MQADFKKYFIGAPMTIKDLIELLLNNFEPEQKLLSQAILPDGKAWNMPAIIFDVPSSSDINGLKYVCLQMNCPEFEKERNC